MQLHLLLIFLGSPIISIVFWCGSGLKSVTLKMAESSIVSPELCPLSAEFLELERNKAGPRRSANGSDLFFGPIKNTWLLQNSFSSAGSEINEISPAAGSSDKSELFRICSIWQLNSRCSLSFLDWFFLSIKSQNTSFFLLEKSKTILSWHVF